MRAVTIFLFLVLSFTLSAQIFVPNAITPNGDGDNDVLVVTCLDTLAEYDFWIFTGYGELVFHADEPTDVWVGGLDYYAPNGVYNYALQWRKDKLAERQRQYGFITVLR